MWLTRIPKTEPIMKTARFERGSYLVFDTQTWDAVRKDNFVVGIRCIRGCNPKVCASAVGRESTDGSSWHGKHAQIAYVVLSTLSGLSAASVDDNF